MNEKKQSKNWKIALVYSLLALIGTVIITSSIGGILAFVFVMKFFGQGIPIVYKIFIAILFFGILIFSSWLSAKKSASYICMKYIINSKDKIIKLATIYYGIILLCWLFKNTSDSIIKYPLLYILILVIVMVMVLVIFYLFSQRYIKNENLESVAIIAQQGVASGKKQIKEWWVSFVYFLETFFGTIVFVSLIIGVTFSILNVPTSYEVLFAILFYIIFMFGLWFCAKFIAEHICRKYIVVNKNKIIQLSTIYFAVVLFAWALLSSNQSSDDFIIINKLADTILVIVTFIIMLIIFYMASKKYIKNDNEILIQ